MVFRKKNREVPDELPPLPDFPKRIVPEGFRKMYGESEVPMESKVMEVEEPGWEIVQIPPTERKFKLRNKITGEEIEPTLEAFRDFLNHA